MTSDAHSEVPAGRQERAISFDAKGYLRMLRHLSEISSAEQSCQPATPEDCPNTRAEVSLATYFTSPPRVTMSGPVVIGEERFH
jgi:hypothetical protein